MRRQDPSDAALVAEIVAHLGRSTAPITEPLRMRVLRLPEERRGEIGMKLAQHAASLLRKDTKASRPAILAIAGLLGAIQRSGVASDGFSTKSTR